MGIYMHDSRKLFHLEVIDTDGDRFVEWEWANSKEEILDRDEMGYEIARIEVRVATEDETDAWLEGHNEALMVNMAEERLANWNGVAYKVESFMPMVSKEVFTCGVCEKSLDIETKAATLGNFYLSVRTPRENQANKTILWHVCIDCSIE
jgi:DNA replicative helicase MCM subunit Mcm2 (Cdc46/Mcm family)